MISWGAPPS